MSTTLLRFHGLFTSAVHRGRARNLVRFIRRNQGMTLLLCSDILLQAAGRIRVLGGTLTSPRPGAAPHHEPFEHSTSKRRAGPGSPVLHVFGSE